MTITTFFFFCYVAVLLLLYYLVPKRLQWIILLMGSIGFYASQNVKSLIFLFAAILIDWSFGLWIQHFANRQATELAAGDLDREAKKQIKDAYKKKKRTIMRWGVLLLLLLLFVMKYTNFTLENVNRLAAAFSFDFSAPKLNILLPLGISFYTFQSIGYLVDLSKDKIKAERNIFRFALFIAFFPQITQGPIGRYSELAPQLNSEHRFEFRNLKFGFELFLFGMFKKLVLADRIGIVVSNVLGDWQSQGSWELILAIALYSIQIYADFSGCMDIVTGIAQMFGIELAQNFNHPNFSRTMPEFWRRWHASLGAWFKDYVFYPISVSNWCQAINRRCRKVFGPEAGRIISGIIPIYAVWFATGIWHGASWKFIMWGVYHGTLIALNLIFAPLGEKLTDRLHIDRERFSFRLYQMIKTYILCMIGRVFFYMSDLKEAIGVFGRILRYNDPWVLINGELFTNLGVDGYDMVVIVLSIVILWAAGVMQERFKIREKLEEQGLLFRWIIVFAAIFIVLIYGQYGQGFDAADFLYKDF